MRSTANSSTRARPAAPIRRAIAYAFYDWTQEMSAVKRLAAWSGLFLQGWAVWAFSVHAVSWAAAVGLQVKIFARLGVSPGPPIA